MVSDPLEDRMLDDIARVLSASDPISDAPAFQYDDDREQARWWIAVIRSAGYDVVPQGAQP